jgi:hypothetical protein
MFEDKLQTRCAICGTGITLWLIFVLAFLPLLLLTVPVAVLFLSIVRTRKRSVQCGMGC